MSEKRKHTHKNPGHSKNRAPAGHRPARRSAAASEQRKPRKRPWWKRRRVRRYIGRTILSLFTFLLLVAGSVYALAAVVFLGPSPTYRNLMVNTALETSAAKFIPKLFFDEQEIAEIVAKNAVLPPEENTDTSLVVVAAEDKTVTQAEDYQDIEIVRVTGPTYKGVMMIVKDPSRVSVGVCNNPLDDDKAGKRIEEIAEQYNAIAAINGGGFEDTNGTGNGGWPIGFVISDGVTLCRDRPSKAYETTMGFTQDNKLVVGNITVDEAEEMGLRDAVQFGPALVINGEPASLSGHGSGLNPRSAIGQRADGAVLLLAIDGRQINSMGATLSDLIDIMLDFDAINAANLDGGSSTTLLYQGEYLNDGTAITGGRRICTAFVVQ